MKYSMGLITLTASWLVAGCAPIQQSSGQTFAGGMQQSQPAPSYGYGYGAAPASPLGTGLGAATELGLVNILVGQLGISPQQALGGVGSIFSVAQQRMSPGDFSLLSNSVPGMDRYLSSAPQQVANSPSLLGAAGSLMGGQLGNLANVAGSFQSLGMNPSMVGQFVPVLLQYVQNQGGAATMNLLQRALY